MLKHSAAKYLVRPKKSQCSLFYHLLQERKKYIWLKILFEGWYLKQEHSKYLRERSVEGGYLMKTAHSGPCTLPHFPNRDEKLRPLVASS